MPSRSSRWMLAGGKLYPFHPNLRLLHIGISSCMWEELHGFYPLASTWTQKRSICWELSAAGSVVQHTLWRGRDCQRAVTTWGGPRYSGEPLQWRKPPHVPLCGLRVKQQTRTHQVILPVWLWLPKVTEVTWYILHSKPRENIVEAINELPTGSRLQKRLWHIL